MAHFAKLDSNNVVQQVIVVNNDVLLDSDGNESEQIGIDFCKSLYGQEANWVQTSYNNTFRKQYRRNKTMKNSKRISLEGTGSVQDL